jgi:hypothetical protein
MSAGALLGRDHGHFMGTSPTALSAIVPGHLSSVTWSLVLGPLVPCHWSLVQRATPVANHKGQVTNDNATSFEKSMPRGCRAQMLACTPRKNESFARNTWASLGPPQSARRFERFEQRSDSSHYASVQRACPTNCHTPHARAVDHNSLSTVCALTSHAPRIITSISPLSPRGRGAGGEGVIHAAALVRLAVPNNSISKDHRPQVRRDRKTLLGSTGIVLSMCTVKQSADLGQQFFIPSARIHSPPEEPTSFETPRSNAQIQKARISGLCLLSFLSTPESETKSLWAKQRSSAASFAPRRASATSSTNEASTSRFP